MPFCEYSALPFGSFAHRTTPNTAPVCISGILHTARPRTPLRCAFRAFCTPHDPEHRSVTPNDYSVIMTKVRIYSLKHILDSN